ncbi:MAG: hypothetical protein JOZ57_00090, partial [Abitibacteriaceae bacterium]|nr:hypothetical protein [Abditibacteriaceae bacterium]
ITGRHTSDDEDGTSYYLEFRYRVGGTDYHDASAVSSAEYGNYNNGAPVSVRVLPQVPYKGAQLGLPSHNAAKHTLFMWAFALFWNAILLAFVWMIYILPLMTRSIVAAGIPASGHIVHKEVISGEDSDTHMIHYEFSPGSMSSQVGAQRAWSDNTVHVMAPMKSKMSVTKAEYSQAQVGDVVTVLHSPKNFKRSVIYRYADYEIIA